MDDDDIFDFDELDAITQDVLYSTTQHQPNQQAVAFDDSVQRLPKITHPSPLDHSISQQQLQPQDRYQHDTNQSMERDSHTQFNLGSNLLSTTPLPTTALVTSHQVPKHPNDLALLSRLVPRLTNSTQNDILGSLLHQRLTPSTSAAPTTTQTTPYRSKTSNTRVSRFSQKVTLKPLPLHDLSTHFDLSYDEYDHRRRRAAQISPATRTNPVSHDFDDFDDEYSEMAANMDFSNEGFASPLKRTSDRDEAVNYVDFAVSKPFKRQRSRFSGIQEEIGYGEVVSLESNHNNDSDSISQPQSEFNALHADQNHSRVEFEPNDDQEDHNGSKTGRRLHLDSNLKIFNPYQHHSLDSSPLPGLEGAGVSSEDISHEKQANRVDFTTHGNFAQQSSFLTPQTHSTLRTAATTQPLTPQTTLNQFHKTKPFSTLPCPSTFSTTQCAQNRGESFAGSRLQVLESSGRRSVSNQPNPLSTPSTPSQLAEATTLPTYFTTTAKRQPQTTSTTHTSFPLIDSSLSTFKPFYQDFLLYTLWGLNVPTLHPKLLRGLYQSTLRLNSIPIPSPLMHHVTAWNQQGLQNNIPVINDQLQFGLIPGLEDGAIQLMSILSGAIHQRCNSHTLLLANAGDLPILCIANVLSHILYQTDTNQLNAVIIHLSGNVSTNDTECIQTLCIQLCEQLGLTCSLNHSTATFHDYAQFITVIFRQITTLDVTDVQNFDSKYQLHEYPAPAHSHQSLPSIPNFQTHQPDHINTATQKSQDKLTSVPIIIILDGFDQFARSGVGLEDTTTRSVSKQSFLYFLGDLAQTNQAWMHIIAVSNSPASYDYLEKRVKSRFPMQNIYLHNSLYQSPPLHKNKPRTNKKQQFLQGISQDNPSSEASIVDKDKETVNESYILKAQGATLDILQDVKVVVERLQLALYTLLALPCEPIDNVTPIHAESVMIDQAQQLLPGTVQNQDAQTNAEKTIEVSKSATTTTSTLVARKVTNVATPTSQIDADTLHDGPVVLGDLLLVPRSWSPIYLHRDFTAPHWTQVFYYNTAVYATLTNPQVVQQVLTPMVYLGISLYKVIVLVTKIVENMLLYPTLLSPTTPPVLQLYPLYCDYVEFKREKRYVQYFIQHLQKRLQVEADALNKTNSLTESSGNAVVEFDHSLCQNFDTQLNAQTFSGLGMNDVVTNNNHAQPGNKLHNSDHRSIFDSIQQVDAIYNYDSMLTRGGLDSDDDSSSSDSDDTDDQNRLERFTSSNLFSKHSNSHITYNNDATSSMLSILDSSDDENDGDERMRNSDDLRPTLHTSPPPNHISAQSMQASAYNDYMVQLQNSSIHTRSTFTNILSDFNQFPAPDRTTSSYNNDNSTDFLSMQMSTDQFDFSQTMSNLDPLSTPCTKRDRSRLKSVQSNSAYDSTRAVPNYKTRTNTSHYKYLTPWRGSSAIASVLLGPWDIFTAWFWLQGHIVGYETTYCELHNQLMSKPSTFFFSNLTNANSLDVLYTPNGVGNQDIEEDRNFNHDSLDSTPITNFMSQNPLSRFTKLTSYPNSQLNSTSGADGTTLTQSTQHIAQNPQNNQNNASESEFVIDVGYIARLLRFFQSDLSHSSYTHHIITSHESNLASLSHYLNLCAENKRQYLSNWMMPTCIQSTPTPRISFAHPAHTEYNKASLSYTQWSLSNHTMIKQLATHYYSDQIQKQLDLLNQFTLERSSSIPPNDNETGPLDKEKIADQSANRQLATQLLQTLLAKYTNFELLFNRTQQYYVPSYLNFASPSHLQQQQQQQHESNFSTPSPTLHLATFCIEPDPDRITEVFAQFQQYKKLLTARRKGTLQKAKLTREQKSLLVTFSRDTLTDIYRVFLKSFHSNRIVYPTQDEIANIIQPTITTLQTPLLSTPPSSRSRSTSRMGTPSSQGGAKQTMISTNSQHSSRHPQTPSSHHPRSRLRPLDSSTYTSTPSTSASAYNNAHHTQTTTNSRPTTPRSCPVTPSKMTPQALSRQAKIHSMYTTGVNADPQAQIDEKMALLQSISGTFSKTVPHAGANLDQSMNATSTQTKTLINPIESTCSSYFQTEQVLFQQLSRANCHALGLIGASIRLESRGIQTYTFDQLFEEHIAFLFTWSTGQIGLEIDLLELYPTNADCSMYFDELVVNQLFVHCITMPVDQSTTSQQLELISLLSSSGGNQDNDITKKQGKANKQQSEINTNGTSTGPAHILTVHTVPSQLYTQLINANQLLSTPVQCVLSHNSFFTFLKAFKSHLAAIKYTRPLDFEAVPIWVDALLDLEIRTTGSV